MKKKNLTTATSTNIPAHSAIYCICAANLSHASYPACLFGNPSSVSWIIIAGEQHHFQKPPD
ncbi:hypothetical protein [Pedobacter westerhofensis]|uniref:hypothetical protein n=1 Tax=Pedobacter westerhofensis TaxID=425512 RepID=UPI0011597EBF|nr:hypothetical protein [Pedobacter westerhofensis]